MYTISLTPDMQASALVLGCMRLTRLTGAELIGTSRLPLNWASTSSIMLIFTVVMAPVSATLANGCASIRVFVPTC